MSGLRVLKFGGASLEDGPAVARAVEVVRLQGGTRPVVVVSAHRGVTDSLEHACLEARSGRLAWDAVRIRHRTLLRQLELAPDLLDGHLRTLRWVLEEASRRRSVDRRVRDHVLSFGERMSARVFAAALRTAGLPATPVDAFDLGLVTSEPGRGPRELVAGERTRRVLEEVPGIPVVTGFLALDGAGHLTTLGRSGSDLSAVWFGALSQAEAVHLWKAVPGIMTADPRHVSAARHVPLLGWTEAAELSAQGAAVLHPDAVEPARRAGLELCLRDVRSPDAPGTRVTERSGSDSAVAIAQRDAVLLVRRRFDPGGGHADQLMTLFERLAAHGIEPSAGGFSGTEAVVLAPEVPGSIGAPDLVVERRWATLAVVGPGAATDAELAGRIARIDRRARLGLRPAPGNASSSCSFLVPRDELTRALQAVHAELFEAEEKPGLRSSPAEGYPAAPDPSDAAGQREAPGVPGPRTSPRG